MSTPRFYVDLGCHNGSTIRDFYAAETFGGFPTREAMSFGFDPLTTYLDEWGKITDEFGTVFSHEAAWTRPDTVRFSERSCDVKSSIVPEKERFDDGVIRDVRTFDIANFLSRFGDGEVLMRMDIEGAEYAVIDRMAKTGTLSKIAYLEWERHWWKLVPSDAVDWPRLDSGAINQLSAAGVKHKIVW